MDQSFGARLRTHREHQQVALSAISTETKIKLSILEGLERDDVSHWPEGIFRRAYVRAYARAVGLDPETLVREFLEVHPDPVVVNQFDTHTELENPRWPAGLSRLVTSAMAAVPSRRQVVERAKAEPVHCAVDDDAIVAVPARSTDVDVEDEPTTDDGNQEQPEINLLAAADLCTRLGRVAGWRDVAPILEGAAVTLDAVGLIVWSWDSRVAALRPSLAHGYTDATLAQMPSVRASAENAIATAFQSGQACVVNGGAEMTGAVVVPLIAHSGCVGVLAVELRHRGEQRESVRALATILAAQLVTIVGFTPLAEAVNA